MTPEATSTRLCLKTHLQAAKRLLMFPLPLATGEGRVRAILVFKQSLEFAANEVPRDLTRESHFQQQVGHFPNGSMNAWNSVAFASLAFSF
jgi:hypothetical protein